MRTKNSQCRGGSLIVTVLLLAAPLFSETLELQQGTTYSGCIDNYTESRSYYGVPEVENINNGASQFIGCAYMRYKDY